MTGIPDPNVIFPNAYKTSCFLKHVVRLIIGKFCAIASGTKFIMGSANHRLCSVATYPFAVFRPIPSSFPARATR